MSDQKLTHSERLQVLEDASENYTSNQSLSDIKQGYGKSSQENLAAESRSYNANRASCFDELGKEYGSHLTLEQTTQFVKDEIEVFGF